MDNFEFVLKSLGPVLLSVRRCSPDLHEQPRIEFWEDQARLQTGCVYLAGADAVERLAAGCVIEPGVILLIGAASRAGQFARLASLRNITVAEFSCSAGQLYNRFTAALEQRFAQVRAAAHGEDRRQRSALCAFWQNVRSRSLLTHLEIRSALQELTPEVRKYYRFLIIDRDDTTPEVDTDEVIGRLQTVLSDCCIFPGGGSGTNEILVLQFFDVQPFGKLENEEAVQELLMGCGMHMILSNSTSDYSRMNTLYLLNRRANYLADHIQLEPGTRVFDYERYSMYMVIDLCSQRYMALFGHSDILYLVHPIVVYLSRYDEQHHSSLRNVLFYYLLNNQDLKRTADMLYMHRNTVTNKLNLIRSICPIDFDDGGLSQRLLFSCQLVLYYERIMSLRLKDGDGAARLRELGNT